MKTCVRHTCAWAHLAPADNAISKGALLDNGLQARESTRDCAGTGDRLRWGWAVGGGGCARPTGVHGGRVGCPCSSGHDDNHVSSTCPVMSRPYCLTRKIVVQNCKFPFFLILFLFSKIFVLIFLNNNNNNIYISFVIYLILFPHVPDCLFNS